MHRIQTYMYRTRNHYNAIIRVCSTKVASQNRFPQEHNSVLCVYGIEKQPQPYRRATIFDTELMMDGCAFWCFTMATLPICVQRKTKEFVNDHRFLRLG